MAQSKEQSLPTTKTGYTREFTGLFLFFWAIFLVLALVSFDKADPTMNHVLTVKQIHNKAGLFGAYVSGFLNEWFGLCSFLWPLFFVAIGCPCLSSRLVINWRRWVGIFLLVLFLMETGVAWNIRAGDFSPGGILGTSLYQSSVHFLNPWGASLFWFFILLIATQLIINISWINLGVRVMAFIRGKWAARKEREAKIPGVQVQVNREDASDNILGKFWAKLSALWPKEKTSVIPDLHRRTSKPKRPTLDQSKAEPDPFFQEPSMPLTKIDDDEDVNVLDLPAKRKAKTKAKEQKQGSLIPQPSEPKPNSQPIEDKPQEIVPTITFSEDELEEDEPVVEAPKPAAKAPKVQPHNRPAHGPFPLPPLDILAPPVETANTENLEAKAQVLMQTLHEFNIDGELVAITPGPVVTLFEVRPATGVRVSKFQSLSDDLARVLMATAVRILAPVPGSDTVGIEIPNVKREIVNFRELIDTQKFREASSPLTMVLGKDTTGNPVYADLAKMPHMLIAGATGTGKSVCLNCILASLLYRTQPDEVKLLLIDPKRVEMSVYADEPHLIHPVVNEPADAKTALEWATHEMDERFKIMSTLGVRNIVGFNKRLATYDKNNRPPEIADFEPLPYIAIVIDELA
ncbi:MAG: DNA translocase FtsK 4TM domain-containing protein, partial [Desulfovibrionaceae bacterium]|nr:DNA translocase FtsK 4TM domain-containing protein [Desulfovibrionaceae bacterium]